MWWQVGLPVSGFRWRARPHGGLVRDEVPGRHGVAVVDHHERVEGGGLSPPLGTVADVEPAARARGEVAVARAVDERLGAPRLASALRLGHDRLDVASGRVAVGRRHGTLQRHAHARLGAHVLAHGLHVLGFVDPVLVESLSVELHALVAGLVHGARAVGVEAADDLPADVGLVEVEDVREEAGRPDAAQATLQLEEPHFRTRARGGDSRRHAGWAAARHDHVGPVVHGDALRRFGERAGGVSRHHVATGQGSGRRSGPEEISACHVHAVHSTTLVP